MITYLRPLIDFFSPPTCLVCHSPPGTHHDLCQSCYDQLPWLVHSCNICGQSINQSAKLCGQCIKKPPPFKQVIVPFEYRNATKELITTLKFNQQLPPAKLLGKLMADYLTRQYRASTLPQAILPIPLHNQRLANRGFNQAIEIAKPIAKKLKLPIIRESVVRRRNTVSQSALPIKQRSKNIRHAFQIVKPLKYQKIVILDDVYTTGNTVLELSKCLKKQSKNLEIDVWCIARAQLH